MPAGSGSLSAKWTTLIRVRADHVVPKFVLSLLQIGELPGVPYLKMTASTPERYENYGIVLNVPVVAPTSGTLADQVVPLSVVRRKRARIEPEPLVYPMTALLPDAARL